MRNPDSNLHRWLWRD